MPHLRRWTGGLCTPNPDSIPPPRVVESQREFGGLMLRTISLAVGILLGGTLSLLAVNAQQNDPQPRISAQAHDLHFSSIVVDTHDDAPQRLLAPTSNTAARTTAA